MVIGILLFVFGTIIGSFLNVVALRWNTGLGLSGRSFCTVCRSNLCWFELVPVASFAVQKGKCRTCKTKISWQYPLVEILTGIIFATLWYAVPATFSPAMFALAYALSVSVFSVYIVILIYDMRHKIIPDPLVYTAMIFALAYRFMFFFLTPSSYLDLLAGPIIFTFFALIWFLSRGRAMGFGDAKLGLSIGLLLGAAKGLSAFVLAFWIGTAAALGIMAVSHLMHMKRSSSPLLHEGKKLTMKSEVPFAPFLIFGAWFALICSLDLFHVTFFF